MKYGQELNIDNTLYFIDLKMIDLTIMKKNCNLTGRQTYKYFSLIVRNGDEMKLLFRKTKELETQIDDYLDILDRGSLLFMQGIKFYFENRC